MTRQYTKVAANYQELLPLHCHWSSHALRRRLTFTVFLKVLEIGPSRTCTLHLCLDRIRKVGEEVETNLGLQLVDGHDVVRVGLVGIFLMLEPETDGAGIGDGFAAPLHLQDRLPVVVRHRDLGRNGAAGRRSTYCVALGQRICHPEGGVMFGVEAVVEVAGRASSEA